MFLFYLVIGALQMFFDDDDDDHAYSATAPLAARASTSDLQDLRLGLLMSSRHRRIWQTTASWPRTSACTDSDRPIQRCTSCDVQVAVLATGVLRLLDVYGTDWQFIYGSVTVLNSLNGCWRPICLVLGTAPLCNALVRSAMHKSSYLLTY